MVELEDDDPRLTASANSLANKLQQFVGREFDEGNVAHMCEMVQEHRREFRQKYNADFPPLVPFVLPSIRFIHFVRPDIEDKEIRIQLRNIIVQLGRRQVLPAAIEIVRAVQLCWPTYKPPIEEFRADPLLKQELQ